jgi:hypothetical protein
MVPKFGSHVREPGTADGTDHDGPFTNVPPKRRSPYKSIGMHQLPSFTISELLSFITTPPSSPPSEHSSVCNTSGDDPFINATSMLPSTPMDDAKMPRLKKKKQKKKPMADAPDIHVLSSIETRLRDESSTPHDIPLQELKEITDNFSDERILGRGGFGVVYKV